VLAIVPEFRSILDGVEGADSLVVNPHKWLFTPFDCSAFFIKRPEILKRAFSLVPEYLVTREQDEVVNYMDYGVQLGRRFRALKLWMIIRAFGTDGLAARLREHVALARTFAGWIEQSGDWKLMAPVPFSLVCFRYAPPGLSESALDGRNEAIMHAVNAGGDVFLSHTKLHHRFTLRLAIGNIRTEERHVALAWQRLQEAALSS
jgi:aromatic-L-amino-acid decarboxylase